MPEGRGEEAVAREPAVRRPFLEGMEMSPWLRGRSKKAIAQEVRARRPWQGDCVKEGVAVRQGVRTMAVRP